MDERSLKGEARLLALEYMLTNLYAILHDIYKSQPEAILAMHEKIRKTLREQNFPGLANGESDLVAAEAQAALENLFRTIEELTGAAKKPAVVKNASPLYPLLDEINRAAAGGMPFLAVAMTVTLPDICMSLISEKGMTKPARYKQWCKENLANDKFTYLTPDDLYSLRCGVVHSGRFGYPKTKNKNVDRVIFALPDKGFVPVNIKTGDAYFYSAVEFCKNFTDAVHDWFEKNKNNANVQKNLPRLVQYRPGGLLPYFHGVGITVLA
jgi:hypothetical protein